MRYVTGERIIQQGDFVSVPRASHSGSYSNTIYALSHRSCRARRRSSHCQGQTFYILTNGKVRVTVVDERAADSAAEREIAQLSAGEYFGEVSSWTERCPPVKLCT